MTDLSELRVAIPIMLARDIVRYLSFFGTTRAMELADGLDQLLTPRPETPDNLMEGEK